MKGTRGGECDSRPGGWRGSSGHGVCLEGVGGGSLGHGVCLKGVGGGGGPWGTECALRDWVGGSSGNGVCLEAGGMGGSSGNEVCLEVGGVGVLGEVCLEAEGWGDLRSRNCASRSGDGEGASRPGEGWVRGTECAARPGDEEGFLGHGVCLAAGGQGASGNEVCLMAGGGSWGTECASRPGAGGHCVPRGRHASLRMLRDFEKFSKSHIEFPEVFGIFGCIYPLPFNDHRRVWTLQKRASHKLLGALVSIAETSLFSGYFEVEAILVSPSLLFSSID
ncbi:hypothetical protein KY285_035695 [Solanum tuberosum]|nr:hypothetical protein KY285_035695 [Solanum tuberosum]